MAPDGRIRRLTFRAIAAVQIAIAVALAAPALATAGGAAIVALAPDQRAGWSAEKFFAPLTGLVLGGPAYWYAPREIRIEAAPESAALELFYVRTNMQRAYAQATAPARLALPPRIETTRRDVVSIRASAPGHRTQTVSVSARTRDARLRIELEPVANRVTSVSHRALAGAGWISFATRERSTLRLQLTPTGFTVTLLESSLDPLARDALAEIGSALVRSGEAHELGQDLVFAFESPDVARGALEIRAGQDTDPIRDGWELRLTLSPTGAGASPVARARAAFAQVDERAISGCARQFERELRSALGAESLASSLSGDAPFSGRYVRAALRRLAELSKGELVLADGSRFRADSALEFEAAAARASEVSGLIALLRAFVSELEPAAQRSAGLRSLIDPARSRSAFAAAVASAERAQARCAAAARGR
jgi:hypothetical protein